MRAFASDDQNISEMMPSKELEVLTNSMHSSKRLYDDQKRCLLKSSATQSIDLLELIAEAHAKELATVSQSPDLLRQANQNTVGKSKTCSESISEFNALKHGDSFDTLHLKLASVASELEYLKENATITNNESEEKDKVYLNEE